MSDFLDTYSGSRIIRRSEVLARGFHDQDIQRELRAGNIMRLAHGAYSAPPSVGDKHMQARELYVRRVLAVAHRMPHAIVSHESAAALYGLPLGKDLQERVHLTRVGLGGSRRGKDFQLHCSRLEPEDHHVMHYRGGNYPAVTVRVTAPARTVLDTCRSGRYASCLALTDAALQNKLVTPPDLERAMEQFVGRMGAARARRVLRASDGRSESPGETRMRFYFAQLGLPPLELQVDVYDSRGVHLGRTDGGYVEDAVLFEFDGDAKYTRLRRPGESLTDVILREKQREHLLIEAGYIVIRFVWKDFYDLDSVRSRVLDAIARGRRSRAAGLVTGSCSPRSPLVVNV